MVGGWGVAAKKPRQTRYDATNQGENIEDNGVLPECTPCMYLGTLYTDVRKETRQSDQRAVTVADSTHLLMVHRLCTETSCHRSRQRSLASLSRPAVGLCIGPTPRHTRWRMML